MQLLRAVKTRNYRYPGIWTWPENTVVVPFADRFEVEVPAGANAVMVNMSFHWDCFVSTDSIALPPLNSTVYIDGTQIRGGEIFHLGGTNVKTLYGYTTSGSGGNPAARACFQFWNIRL